MDKTVKPQPIRYSILRLQPHIETEEFANVGIALVAPELGYFDFRIETRRIGRYTSFFDQIDSGLLRSVLKHVARELARVRDLVGFDPDGQMRFDLDKRERADHLFAALVKDREGTIIYSDVRYAIHPDPKAMLDELFNHYVARAFIDHAYRETAMARALRSKMRLAGIDEKFKGKRYDDGVYAVHIPFVGAEPAKGTLALKPLFLGHDNPGRILDHANKWSFAVRRLRSRLPDKITFAVEGPDEQGPATQAFREATSMLKGSGIEVVGSEAEAMDAAAAYLQ